MLSSLWIVITVTTRQLPLNSYPSLISVLHVFHPNDIWALLPEDTDMVWSQGFRCTTQYISFCDTHSLSTGCCPGSRWHLLEAQRSLHPVCLPLTTSCCYEWSVMSMPDLSLYYLRVFPHTSIWNCRNHFPVLFCLNMCKTCKNEAFLF